MALVTSAAPYSFSGATGNHSIVIGVKLNGGYVVTEQLVNGEWVNTGDTYSNGSHQLTVGQSGADIRLVCTGLAVVSVP